MAVVNQRNVYRPEKRRSVYGRPACRRLHDVGPKPKLLKNVGGNAEYFRLRI